MKENKGITLVALIITIIVMLILVAVTVSILINSNVIGKAKSAGTQTEAAYANESNLGEELAINIGGTTYNSIDEVINSKPGPVDESAKLYEALQNKTGSEIVAGVNVDGINTVFVSALDYLPECTIEYNGQEYIVVVDPTSGVFSNVLLVDGEKIIFWLDRSPYVGPEDKHAYIIPTGLTFGEWVDNYHPEGFLTTETIVCFERETPGPAYAVRVRNNNGTTGDYVLTGDFPTFNGEYKLFDAAD